MDLFERTEDKLKVEMMTVLMTLKTHSRLATMKHSSLNSVPADLSLIEHVDDTGRDSHHNYEQMLTAGRQRSKIDSDCRQASEDNSLSHSQTNQLQDHSELEEFLRYEAEISGVLQRARNSQQKRLQPNKERSDGSQVTLNRQPDPDSTMNLSHISSLSAKAEDKKTPRNSASEKQKKSAPATASNVSPVTQKPPTKPPQSNKNSLKGK